MKSSSTLFSSVRNSISSTDDWATPTALVLAIEAKLGIEFNLDPCCKPPSSVMRRLGRESGTSYTYFENGLIEPWEGFTAFINPPYSAADAWIRRAWSERHHCTSVALIPARTDTAMWHRYIFKPNTASQILFMRGRVAFELDGQPVAGAPFPTAVVMWSAGHTGPPIVSSWRWRLATQIS
jgi:site-specific DNA-methyltransferase (adenine-specific)